MSHIRPKIGESYKDRLGRIVEIKEPFVWMLPGLFLGSNGYQYTVSGKCFSPDFDANTFDLVHNVKSIRQKAIEALDEQIGANKDAAHKAIREDPIAYKIYQCAINALMEEMSND